MQHYATKKNKLILLIVIFLPIFFKDMQSAKESKKLKKYITLFVYLSSPYWVKMTIFYKKC